MGFGQYSDDAQPRRSKREMVATVTGIHGEPVKAALVARNTLDYTTADGTRRVRYHDTDVVTVKPDGVVELDTGGYNTLTTRDRMNHYGGHNVRVYTDKGTIFARPLKTDESYAWSGGVPFRDKATISPDGKVTPDQSPAELSVLPKLIDAYIKALKKNFPRLGADGKPNSAGDPWMISGSIPSHDVALDWLGAGEEPSGEPYIFNTIVFHAFKASGMTDLGAHMLYEKALRQGLDNYATGKVRRLFKKALGL